MKIRQRKKRRFTRRRPSWHVIRQCKVHPEVLYVPTKKVAKGIRDWMACRGTRRSNSRMWQCHADAPIFGWHLKMEQRS